MCVSTPPIDQSDQSLLLENDITVHKRSRGAQSADHERVSEDVKRVHRPTNIFLNLSDNFSKNDSSVSAS